MVKRKKLGKSLRTQGREKEILKRRLPGSPEVGESVYNG